MIDGYDVSGVVSAVGPGVKKFKVGDKVCGNMQPKGITPLKNGSWAEYTVVKEDFLGGCEGIAKASPINSLRSCWHLSDLKLEHGLCV